MIDNVIPYIKGEDEKSEIEPLKTLGVGWRVRDQTVGFAQDWRPVHPGRGL